MWILVDQEAIKRLNEAVNQQWALLAHLRELLRWNSNSVLISDLLLLWENTEDISEALCEAIIWEEFA